MAEKKRFHSSCKGVEELEMLDREPDQQERQSNGNEEGKLVLIYANEFNQVTRFEMLTYVVVYWVVHIFSLFSFGDKKPFHHIKSERTQKHLSEKKAVKQSPVSRQKARKTMLVLLSILEAAAAKLWWTQTQLLCFPCQCAVLKPFIMLHLSGGSQGKLYQPSHDSGSAMETCCEGSPLKDSIAHTHTH